MLPFRSARYATTAGAALMLAGAALLWLTVALPPPAVHSDAVIAIAATLVAIIGVVLLRIGEVPPGIRFLCATLGTFVITLTAYETGFGDRGAGSNGVLFIWPALYCALFLPWRMALAELALIICAYGVLAFTTDPFAPAFTRWLVASSTMVVVVVLVGRLRATLDDSVDELSALADQDPLTGVVNRRALLQRAAAELSRCRLTGEPLSVIAADLDHLKKLNDARGHAAGDRALKSTARALTSNTREIDTVARVGGDEFLVLLPGADEDEAMRVAGRLRAAPLGRDELADGRLSLSVGVATAGPEQTFDEIWKAADDALYQFKRRARKDSVELGT